MDSEHSLQPSRWGSSKNLPLALESQGASRCRALSGQWISEIWNLPLVFDSRQADALSFYI
jgi:hypothetical protein